jgi:hypothetical protein
MMRLPYSVLSAGHIPEDRFVIAAKLAAGSKLMK